MRFGQHRQRRTLRDTEYFGPMPSSQNARPERAAAAGAGGLQNFGRVANVRVQHHQLAPRAIAFIRTLSFFRNRAHTLLLDTYLTVTSTLSSKPEELPHEQPWSSAPTRTSSSLARLAWARRHTLSCWHKITQTLSISQSTKWPRREIAMMVGTRSWGAGLSMRIRYVFFFLFPWNK